MGVETIYHTGIVVSDLERSLRFYMETLGLTIERPTREITGEWISAVTGHADTSLRMVWVGTGDGYSIELLEYRQPPGDKGPNERGGNDVGAMHVGMIVDDVHAWYARLSAQGVTFAGPPPPKQDAKFPWARCAAYLQDPDGNWLELLEREPVPTG